MPNLNQVAAQAYTWQGTDLTFIARVQGKNSSNNLINLQQSDVSGISYTTYDTSTGGQVGSGSLTVSAVIFNSLQTGTVWSQDATGFNFLTTIAAAGNFPAGNKTYLIAFQFTLAAGGVFELVFSNITRSISTG